MIERGADIKINIFGWTPLKYVEIVTIGDVVKLFI